MPTASSLILMRLLAAAFLLLLGSGEDGHGSIRQRRDGRTTEGIATANLSAALATTSVRIDIDTAQPQLSSSEAHRDDRRIQSAPALRNLMLSMMCVPRVRHPSDQSAACPAIEVSVVADVQSDSTRPVTLNDGTTILLTRTPLVTSADITGANASLTEGQYVLNVDVTDESAKRVQVFSKQNVGRTMAFLVDGKVRSTPRILDPITGKGFLIGGFEQADAERLATAISNGCKGRARSGASPARGRVPPESR